MKNQAASLDVFLIKDQAFQNAQNFSPQSCIKLRERDTISNLSVSITNKTCERECCSFLSHSTSFSLILCFGQFTHTSTKALAHHPSRREKKEASNTRIFIRANRVSVLVRLSPNNGKNPNIIQSRQRK
jgi:hypothetical protein